MACIKRLVLLFLRRAPPTSLFDGEEEEEEATGMAWDKRVAAMVRRMSIVYNICITLLVGVLLSLDLVLQVLKV
jgi:hypothetical protein